MKPIAKRETGDYRSEVMRARLMDATLTVILEEGWAGASTPKICRKANVSRGAQTHHFPTKISLFMAAIEDLARQSEAHILNSIEETESTDRSLRDVLRLIWEAMLSDQYMQTAMEAMVAARTDPELRTLMADLDDKSIMSMRSVAETLAYKKESVERVKDAIELSIYLFRGIVVERGLHDNEKFKGHLFEVWCELVEKALAEDRQADAD